MHRFFLTENFKDKMTISGKDGHHIGHVLRMKVADQLQIVSLDQITALMQITGFTGDSVSLELVEIIEHSHESTVKMILAQGLPKGDKMELIIQKAVEIGVSEICPVTLTNCVVRLDEAKAQKKVQRWQKIAEEAAKQSKRDIVPKIMEPLTLSQLIKQYQDIDLKLVAYEVEEKNGLRSVLSQDLSVGSILVLIGPEGGITKEEWLLAQSGGLKSVSLGKRILRTETAAISLLAAIAYATGNLGE